MRMPNRRYFDEEMMVDTGGHTASNQTGLGWNPWLALSDCVTMGK